MQARAILLGLSLLALTAVPTSGASLGATTLVGATCAMTDNDACSQPWASIDTLYSLTLAGRFTGTATITVTSVSQPSISYTLTCTGDMIGIVVVNGYCAQGGTFPVGAMTMSCSSSGVGIVACSTTGY